MSLNESILLGILQGITEFLPISSSGHLTLVQHLLGVGDTPLVYDVFLHLSSLAAVIIFFKRKIFILIKSIFNRDMKSERIEILFIIISTLATATLLPLTKPVIMFIKKSPAFLLFTFLFTGLLLTAASRMLKKETDRTELTLKDSIIIGIFQGFAVIPGISRSGSTIFAGLFTGLSGIRSVEYSFLLAIPAISGAMILESLKLDTLAIDSAIIISGCISSFIFSLLSLKFLVYLIKKLKLMPLVCYLLIISSAVFYIYWI